MSTAFDAEAHVWATTYAAALCAPVGAVSYNRTPHGVAKLAVERYRDWKREDERIREERESIAEERYRDWKREDERIREERESIAEGLRKFFWRLRDLYLRELKAAGLPLSPDDEIPF